MKKLFYPAIFEPDEDRGFTVQFPDLPECLTEGEGMDEAYEMAFDCLGLVLSYKEDHDESIPLPSLPQDIALEEGQFLVVVEFDMSEYRKRTSSQAVKKTLSIPSWLNVEAEKAGVNFSATLQDALKKQLGFE